MVIICPYSRSWEVSVGREAGSLAFDVTLKDYLKEIDEASLLTFEEERDLGKMILDENDPPTVL